MNSKFILLLIFIFCASSKLASSFDKCVTNNIDPSLCTITGVRDPKEMYGLALISQNIILDNIKKINFNDSRIYHIPKELTYFFKNLEDLDASNVFLSRFDSMDFQSENKLKKLNVSGNVIHVLPRRLTQKFNKLEVLDISYNFIDTIASESFSYKENLKFLNLSHNKIKILNVDFMDAIKNVKILNLGYNEISEFDSACPNISFEIEELYLNDNELKSFEHCLIENLKTFDIGNNKLSGQFDFVDTEIINLNVQGNSIQSLNISNKLEILDVSSNSYESLKINFEDFSSLKKLNLSNLGVSDNEQLLQQLKMLHNLEILDISHNNLKTLDFTDFPLSIEFLNIEQANLQILNNYDVLDLAVPNLKQINIKRNSFSCKEFAKLIYNFEKLNMNVTGLTNQNRDEFIQDNCVPDESHENNKSCFSELSSRTEILLTISFLILIAFIIFLYHKAYMQKKPTVNFLLKDF